MYENQDTIGEIVIWIEYGWMNAVEYKIECINTQSLLTYLHTQTLYKNISNENHWMDGWLVG